MVVYRSVGIQTYFLSNMPKTRQEKEATLAGLVDRLQRMTAVVFAGYQGLTVKQITELRNQLRSGAVDMIVAKKTVLRKALVAAKLDQTVVDELEGAIAVVVGFEDEILPAKLLQQFAKKNNAVVFKGGYVGREFYPAERITALAKLPGRQELLTQTVWVIKGPVTGFVNVLSGIIKSFINVISAIKDKPAA